MTQLNLDLSRAKPAQIRSMYRAAMTNVAAEMASLRDEGKGDAYPPGATFDRVIDALRQARVLAESARERVAAAPRAPGATAETAPSAPSPAEAFFGVPLVQNAEPAGEAVTP